MDDRQEGLSNTINNESHQCVVSAPSMRTRGSDLPQPLKWVNMNPTLRHPKSWKGRNNGKQQRAQMVTRQASKSHIVTTNSHPQSEVTPNEDDEEAFLPENQLLNQSIEESLQGLSSTSKPVHMTTAVGKARGLYLGKRNIVDLTGSTSPPASPRPAKVNIEEGRAPRPVVTGHRAKTEPPSLAKLQISVQPFLRTTANEERRIMTESETPAVAIIGNGTSFPDEQLYHTRLYIKTSVSQYAMAIPLYDCSTVEAFYGTIDTICGQHATKPRVLSFTREGFKAAVRIPEDPVQGFALMKDCILEWDGWYKDLDRLYKCCDVWIYVGINQKYEGIGSNMVIVS